MSAVYDLLEAGLSAAVKEANLVQELLDKYKARVTEYEMALASTQERVTEIKQALDGYDDQ